MIILNAINKIFYFLYRNIEVQMASCWTETNVKMEFVENRSLSALFWRQESLRFTRKIHESNELNAILAKRILLQIPVHTRTQTELEKNQIENFRFSSPKTSSHLWEKKIWRPSAKIIHTLCNIPYGCIAHGYVWALSRSVKRNVKVERVRLSGRR